MARNINKEAQKAKMLKAKHFQTPELLCEFVNHGNIEIVTICPFDRFQVIYYYDLKN